MTVYVPGAEEKDTKRLILSLQQLAAGRSNAVGTVTCSTNSTTVVTDMNCNSDSVVALVPATANAAAIMNSLYVTPGVGSFTITHGSTTSNDRTFKYAIQG